MLSEVNNALEYLQQLHTQYVHVSTKTNALHEECEHLLAEQVSGAQAYIGCVGAVCTLDVFYW